jgi:hypothetical protein
LPTDVGTAAGELVRGGFGLYLASNAAVLEHLDDSPLGIPVTPLDFLRAGPQDWDVRDFLRVYHKLNGVSFGPKGIPVDLWVMIDLGLLASAFLLVTLPLERVVADAEDPSCRPETRAKIAALLERVRELDYAGPVPVAGYCASPTAVPGRWVGWSLCSILPGRDLGWVAKGLALAAYRARMLSGVAQYDSPALRIHRTFGPMRLISATLDLHPVPHTMAYETDLDGADHEPEPTWLVDARDTAKHREMQAMLDAGTHDLHILKPGLTREGLVPVLATPAA